MHIPKVNLSTTNKTTRENHPLFDQRAQLNAQTKKYYQMGIASGSFYDHDQRVHKIVESVESELKHNHKRMQSLVTDPQFITKLGFDQNFNAEAAEHQMQDLAKRHTTKNTGGNPSIFTKGDLKSEK